MIVLDTTVLVYAVGEAHPLRDPCRRVLRAQGDGSIDAATTIEMIQEFVHVRSRRRSRDDAAALGRHYRAGLQLLSSDASDLDLGLILFERYPPIGAFDALLAAVALNRRADALISADRAFAMIPGLHWVDPATSALDKLLGRA